MKRATWLVLSLVVAAAALGAVPAFAAVTVTAATNGTGISADTTGGAYTTLTGPIVDENNLAEIGTGRIDLNLPSGFEFSTATVAVSATPVGGNSFRLSTAAGCTSPSTSVNVTPTTSTITVYVCATSTAGGKKTKVTWSLIKVRPTAGTPLASGNISAGGTAAINGVNGSTNLGTLTEVAGAYHHLNVLPDVATIIAGGSQAFTARSEDQFNNEIATVTGATTFEISPNGSCTGANCTATVAGAHSVTGTNSGKSDTSTLTVNAGAPTHISIAPQNATTTAGTGVAYTTTGLDAYDNSTGDVTGATTFTIDGSPCGSSTCTSTVAGAHTVTGTHSAGTASTGLTVDAGSLDHITISPPAATILAGGSQPYTATGFDQYDNSLGAVAATYTIEPDGSCPSNSCSANVAGSHTVTGSFGGKSATASLTVTHAAAVSIEISPSTATITAGDSQAYTATGTDAYGNSFDVTSGTSFDVDGNACSGASCSPTGAGDHTVTGTYGSLSDAATLTVTHAAAVSIEISPSTATITAGDSQAYTATGTDPYGNSFDVTGNTAFTVDGSACDSATCSPTQAGEHTVTGTYGLLSDDATITVEHADADSVEISPAAATIAAGGSQAYTAEATDAYGNTFDVTGGTSFGIAPDGSCAGDMCGANIAGPHTVTGTYGTLSDDATLAVTPAGLASIDVNPDGANIVAGGSQAYTATGYDVFGNEIGDVTSGTSFSIAPEGSCSADTCTASAAGPHTVTGTNGAASDTVGLSVSTGAAASLTAAADPDTVTASPSENNTSTISVTVKDQFGNPVAGASVGFAFGETHSGLGLDTPFQPTLSAPAGTTNGSGIATVTYTAGALFGTDEIVVSSGTLSATVTITVDPLPCDAAPVPGVCSGAPAPATKPAPPVNAATAAVQTPANVRGLTGL